MCAPSPPKAPDPKQQGAAQTASNVSTATANAALGNINEYTPQGSVIRKQTGTQQIWDENLGKTISVPTYSTYQSYSPQEQAIYSSGAANRLGVNALAGTMIDQVGNVVSKGIDYSKLPAGGDASQINLPKYTQFGAGPNLQTSIAGAGDINRTFGETAGRIQYDLPGADDFSKDRLRYENAVRARQNPQLQQDRERLNQQAVNQGLMPGSVAYDRWIDQQGRKENDAEMTAILAGGQEQQRMFGMGLAAGNFNNAAQAQDYMQQLGRGAFSNEAQAQLFGQNAQQAAFGNTALQQMADNAYRRTAGNNTLQDQGFNAQSALFGMQNTDRQNALGEAYQQYTLPINTIGALMSGGQVSQPQYAGANMPQLPNVDWAGLYQNEFTNKMAGYNAQTAPMNSAIEGAGSLFGSIIGASDIRLKDNIEPLGRVGGHNVYAFDYKNPADGSGRQVGVMAQEVLQTRPDAVLERADGMLMVDYSKLFGGRN